MLAFPLKLIVKITNYLQKKPYDEVFDALDILKRKFNQKKDDGMNNEDVCLYLSSEESDFIASKLSMYPFFEVFSIFDEIKKDVKEYDVNVKKCDTSLNETINEKEHLQE
jgi:hypothetical protein